jgi:hypothetical protein
VIITSIKPNVSRAQAVAKFTERFIELRRGQLRIATDFYIPYRFFRLTCNNGRSSAEALLAADAVTGRLDPIQFIQLPEEGNCMTVDSAMVADEGVSEEEGRLLVRESMMRSIFLKGFFRLNRMNVEIELVRVAHIPYWVGIYERGERAHLEIINALRGRFEGAKLREIVVEWFQSNK